MGSLNQSEEADTRSGFAPYHMTTFETCPKCCTPIPHEPLYGPWCEHCNWNLLPEDNKKKRNILEKIYDSLGKRWTKDHLKRMCQNKPTPPKISLLRLVA